MTLRLRDVIVFMAALLASYLAVSMYTAKLLNRTEPVKPITVKEFEDEYRKAYTAYENSDTDNT